MNTIYNNSMYYNITIYLNFNNTSIKEKIMDKG